MTHDVITKGCALRAEPGTGRTLKFTISTRDVDRMNDTIDPNGWVLDDWKANPIVLFGHDHGIPAIARGIAIGVERGALKSTAEFPPEGMHPLADTVFNLAKSGFLTSASVGFIPVKWSFNDRGGRDFTEQRLMEWSVVNVPALPQAQLEAAMGAAAAVQKWFGSGRGPQVLDLDDEDVGLDASTVVQAVRALVPAMARAAVARQQHRVEDDVIDLDGAGFDPTASMGDARLLAEAFKIALPQLVRKELLRLRGRVD